MTAQLSKESGQEGRISERMSHHMKKNSRSSNVMRPADFVTNSVFGKERERKGRGFGEVGGFFGVIWVI